MTIFYLIVCNKNSFFNRFGTFNWNFEEQRLTLFVEEQPEEKQSSQTDLQTYRHCASTKIVAFAAMLHCFEKNICPYILMFNTVNI